MESFILVSQTDVKSKMVLWASIRLTRPKLSFTIEFRFQFMKVRNWFCKGGPGFSSTSLANRMRRHGNQRGVLPLCSWHHSWRTTIDNKCVDGDMASERINTNTIWKQIRAKYLQTFGSSLVHNVWLG